MSGPPHPLTTAPRDGTLIRLWLAGAAEPIVAYWSKPLHGWVGYDDPLRRVLHGVLGWEPNSTTPPPRLR